MPYWYLQERLTRQPASRFHTTPAAALGVGGHSELLELVEDSGRLHGMGIGFGPYERPRMGQEPRDPAWDLYVLHELGRLKQAYRESGSSRGS